MVRGCTVMSFNKISLDVVCAHLGVHFLTRNPFSIPAQYISLTRPKFDPLL